VGTLARNPTISVGLNNRSHVSPTRGPLRDVNVKERNLSANAGASSTRFADKVGRDPRAEKCRDRSVELPPYGPSTRR